MNEESMRYVLGVMDLEEAKTHVEKVMMGINPKTTDRERRFYIAGVIDTLYDAGKIDGLTRSILYTQYAF